MKTNKVPRPRSHQSVIPLQTRKTQAKYNKSKLVTTYRNSW